MNIPNLIDVLKAETEQKQKPTEENTQQQSATPPNFDDFLDEPEPEPEKVEPPKPKLSLSDHNKSAEMFIMTVDGLQTISLPWLYQKTLFKKSELEELKAIKLALKEKTETSLTQKQLVLLDKYSTYEELKEGVSFSKDEIELLKGPLGKVFEKYDVDLGPEILLFGAVAAVMLPRYIPFLSNLEE
ncbi:MAG: hypothetical protein K0B10_07220 [Vicingaceae bacterium]|nr:hypothetical protein [Vicingaceae bacterium]